MFFRENYFSKPNTDHLKGVAAILIVLHHLYQQTALTTDWGVLAPIMQYFGYGLVAVFFFVSGYGITLTASRKTDYVGHFLSHRVLPLFLLYCFLVVLYVISDWLLKDTLPTGRQLLQSFLIGSTVVSHGWFFQSILIFYLCFYLSWKFTRRYRFTLLVTTLCAYILICILCHIPISYYVSTPVFYLGCYFAVHKDSVDSFCRHHLLPTAGIVVILTIFLFVKRNSLIINTLPPPILLGVLNIFFVSSIVVLTMLLPAQAKILDIFAAVSLEIYYIQGLAFRLLRNSHWHLSSDLCYILGGLTLTFVLAYGFRPVTRWVMALPSYHKRIKG